MTAISSKSSVLGVEVESTEGTLKVPSDASHYIAIRPDIAMAPNTESQANEEVRSSIGAAKPILGLETPTFSMPHYLRASGVEGSAPGFRYLLKGLFGGEAVAGTEYDTVSSSTVSVVKVNTGEGANFRRGQALLIKDPTNGYRIRAIHSISGDNLTIGFDLPNAPGTGVNLGKAITYYPTNSGHNSLSLWHYLGNSGGIQAMAGAKVISGEFSAEAGSLVDATYSLEGTAYYFDPLIVTSSKCKLDFNDGSVRVATVAQKAYKSPYELASALQVAMNAVGSSDEFTVTYSKTTGKYTIATDGASLSLLWNTGANTANTIGTLLGFSVAADDTSALTYTSDNAISFVAPHTPTYDNADPSAAKNQEVMVGTSTDYLCFNASSVSVSVANTKSNTLSICAESGVSGSVITGRTVTASVSALLDQYDASIYNKYQTGDEVRFQYSFGQKSGGNWLPGKAGCIYLATATVSSFEVVDVDGQVGVNIELTGFVDSSGNGEAFISFV